MPAIPHWGYNGCGRTYWDFIYGGSNTMRIERIMSLVISSAICLHRIESAKTPTTEIP
jgi:hypothetical protein